MDRQLQVFLAVARHLSFTKAAEAVFMTQPAVTFRIRQLEEQFGVRLFDRITGRVTLTPAGAVAVDYAERILALWSELDSRLKEMGSKVAGALCVGASTTLAEFLLPRILSEFKSRFPALTLRLVVGNSELVQNGILERTLDLGFIEGDSHAPSLVSDICGEDELVFACAPSHPLAKEAAITPRQLLRYPYMRRETGSGTREVTDQYFSRAGVSPQCLNTVMEASSPEALKGLAMTGLGFAIMSCAAVANEVRLGQLVQIPLAPRLIRYLSVVYAKERFHSKVVNSFAQFAKEKLAGQTGRLSFVDAPENGSEDRTTFTNGGGRALSSEPPVNGILKWAGES
jgi:DNA-binding transcriptional LysR family regulator